MYSDVIDSRLRARESLLAVFGGVLVLTVLSLPHLGDRLIVDEAIFGSTIRSLAEDGLPHYYAGESVGWKSGLWHPPTYIYYVSVWFSTLGSTSFVARLSTLLFSVLTVPAIVLLTLTVSDEIRDNGQIFAVLGAVAIYVTSPLVIQNATLVDIDGSILALAVVLYVTWVIRTFGSTVQNWPRALGLFAAWVACIAWIKFGVLPVLLLTTAIYVGYKNGVRRGIHVCAAAAGGLVAFAVSWGIVASILDLSFVHPFSHNFGSLLEGGAEISFKKRLLLTAWGFYTEVLWFSPFLLCLGCVAVIGRQWRLRSAPAFAFGIAVLTVVQYALLAKVPYGFPKYLGVGTPLVSVLGGVVLGESLRSVTELRTWLLLGITTIAVAIGTLLLGDPYLVPFDSGYNAVLRDTVINVAAVLGITIITLVVIYRTRWTATRRHLIVAALVVLLMGTNAGIITHQATGDYSTRYFYGIEGTDGAISATVEAYDDLPTDRKSATVVPVDFGFYIDGKFHAAKRYDVSDFEAQNPPLVVLRTQKYYAVESPLLDRLQDSPEYTSKQYGSYLIFVRTS